VEDAGLGGQRARALGFCRVVMRCRASVPFPVISTLDDVPSAEPAQSKRLGDGCGAAMTAVWQTDTIAQSTQPGCVAALASRGPAGTEQCTLLFGWAGVLSEWGARPHANRTALLREICGSGRVTCDRLVMA